MQTCFKTIKRAGILLCFFTHVATAQTDSLAIEKAALHFVMNNFDTIPIYNFSFFKENKCQNVYYYYFTALKPGMISDKVENYRRDSIFDSKTDSVKLPGLKRYNLDVSSQTFSTPYKMYSYSDIPDKNYSDGQIFIAIWKKWQYRDHYYVAVQIDSHGTIEVGDILLKFDLQGHIVRVITEQGEI